MSRKKVAVVGSGCSGIGALWALRDSPCFLHLYESESRLGGHTNTVPFTRAGISTFVDAGFIAMNQETYPNFVRLLDHLGIERVESDMSLAFSKDSGAFEWAGTSVLGLFAQVTNIFRLSFWRMIFDIARFNCFAVDILHENKQYEIRIESSQGVTTSSQYSEDKTSTRYESIGSYLRRHRYSRMFIDNYLVPMLAATWCTRPDVLQLHCPAQDIIEFMWNHHLTESLSNPLKWYTILGGANTYLQHFIALYPPAKTFLNSRVDYLERTPEDRVTLRTSNGQEETYDHVILAGSAKSALQILGHSATSNERQILSQFQTCKNIVWLHSDVNLMPHRRSAWSGWNYLASSTSPSFGASQYLTPSVTFDMNTLQHVPREIYGSVLFTMNPPKMPSVSSIQGSWTYDNPVYSANAVRAQSRLPQIQGVQGVSFAGAWTGYGFHEDGLTSGIRAAVQFLEQTGLDKGPEANYVEKYKRKLPCRHSLWDCILRTIIQGLHYVLVALEEVAASSKDPTGILAEWLSFR